MSVLRRFAAYVPLFALVAIGSSSCSDCELQVATTSLPDAEVGVAYAMFLDSSCGGDTWFLYGGSLPPGIGLRDDGLLTGTPTIRGDFGFTVGVYDFGSNETAYQGLVLRVRDPES